MALVRIRLADSDRERYDLPEWLEFDLYRPMLSQVKLLKQQTGMSWGELQQRVVVEDLEALGVVYWLAVRAVGRDVSWDDFEADLTDVDSKGVDDDPNSSGPAGDGPNSTSSPRRSRASTASTRGTSKGSPRRSSTNTSKS